MCAIPAGEGKSALFCTEFSEEVGDAPNSVTNSALIFSQCWKKHIFQWLFCHWIGDDLLATNSSLNPVMKISLFSFVIFWVTEFSAYVCTEVDENDLVKILAPNSVKNYVLHWIPRQIKKTRHAHNVCF